MLFERMSGSFGGDGDDGRVVVVVVVMVDEAGMLDACCGEAEDWRYVGGMYVSIGCAVVEVSRSTNRGDVVCRARLRTGSCICLDCAGLDLGIDGSRVCEEICRAF